MQKVAGLVVLVGSVVASAAPAPEVLTFSGSTVTGALDGNTVDPVVKQLSARLVKCNEGAFQKQPDIVWSGALTFTIAPGGAAIDPSMSGLSPEGRTCVAAVVATLRFPARPVSTSATYNLTFNAANNLGSGAGAGGGATIGAGYGTGGLGLAGSHPGGIGTIGGAGYGHASRPAEPGQRIGGASADGPTTSLGTVTVTGALDRAVVRRLLAAQGAAFQHCYDQVRVATPSFAGTLVLTFSVDGTGAVDTMAIAGTHDHALEGCAATVLHDLKFPAPTTAPVKVTARLGYALGAAPTK